MTRLALVPLSVDPQCPYSVLYSTRTTLTLQPPRTPLSNATHLLTSAGARGATCINCFDFNSQTIACGTSAFGYRVQLFDLPTGAHKLSLGGHGLEVMCVNVSSSPPYRVISGSADKRCGSLKCYRRSVACRTATDRYRDTHM